MQGMKAGAIVAQPGTGDGLAQTPGDTENMTMTMSANIASLGPQMPCADSK
jgi:hypothetical protein